MDDPISTTSDNLDQTDEDILTYTVSDDALEARSGRVRHRNTEFGLLQIGFSGFTSSPVRELL